MRGLTIKGHKRTFWNDRNVLYLDWVVYNCQNSLNCIFIEGIFHCHSNVNYTSLKLNTKHKFLKYLNRNFLNTYLLSKGGFGPAKALK